MFVDEPIMYIALLATPFSIYQPFMLYLEEEEATYDFDLFVCVFWNVLCTSKQYQVFRLYLPSQMDFKDLLYI